MILYAMIADPKTNKCFVGLGTDEEFYKSLGMTKMDVAKAWDGNWYRAGFVPEKPASVEKEETLANLKSQLEALDEKSNRSMRAILAGTATDDDRSYLASLETQAIDLRRQIRDLGGAL